MMEIDDLNEEQLHEISVQLHQALKEDEADKLEDLDFQLIIWDVLEDFGIPNYEIGALIKQHGDLLIGKVHAERLIGILDEF